MKNLFFERIRQPSTWAGIAALGALFGIPAELVGLVGQVAMGAGGIAAIVLSESKK